MNLKTIVLTLVVIVILLGVGYFSITKAKNEATNQGAAAVASQKNVRDAKRITVPVGELKELLNKQNTIMATPTPTSTKANVPLPKYDPNVRATNALFGEQIECPDERVAERKAQKEYNDAVKKNSRATKQDRSKLYYKLIAAREALAKCLEEARIK